METRNSFSIDFITRKCKTNLKQALIYVRITVNGNIKEISIKEKIDACLWNGSAEIVNGKSIEVKTINHTIDNIRYRIKEKYRELEDKGILVTVEAVKNSYLGIQLSQRGHKMTELLEYFVKIWKGKMKHGGYKNYETTISYLKLFFIRPGGLGDIYLPQLNMEIVTEFEHFIRNNPVKSFDPCLGNGVAKHIQRFKRIINWAVEIQWLPNNPIDRYSCPVKKNKRKKLTIQQLVALEQKTFTDDSLNMIRDLFLTSCYTGFAFADVMELRESHFELDTDGTVWCKLYRLKTDNLSPVPVLKSASVIIDKYKKHRDSITRGTVFPLFTNQYVNRCLKVIREACEFDIPLTFHIARHTFAKTVSLKNGIPLETVQMMMGHTKISTTQIYADVDEEKILNDVSGLEEKMQVKRAIILNTNP